MPVLMENDSLNVCSVTDYHLVMLRTLDLSPSSGGKGTRNGVRGGAVG